MTDRWVRLGEILRAYRRPVEVDLRSTYLPVGVRAFGRGIFDYPSTPGGDLGKLRFFELAPSSLIISNIKAWEGAVDRTDPQESGRIASNRFLMYASASEEADLGYVLHWLLSDGGIATLNRPSPGSADRNRTLSSQRFEAIKIPLPSAQEQRRIAAYIDQTVSAQLASQHRGRNMAALLPILRDQLLLGIGGRRTKLNEIATLSRDAVPVLEHQRFPMLGLRNRGRGLFRRENLRGAETKYTRLFPCIDWPIDL